MKKFGFTFGMMILLSAFLVACKSECIINPPEPITYAGIEDSVIYESMILPDGSDTVLFKLNYQFYSNTKEPYQDSINKIIRQIILLSTQFEEPEVENNENISHDFFSKQLQLFKNTADEVLKESEYPMLWDYDCVIEIDQKFEKYEQVSCYIYTFTGGAHGNGYAEFNLISKETGKILTLSDIVNDESAFTKIAEEYFRIERELADTADLDNEGYWFSGNKFACNDNFYFKDDAIFFFFNSYEIAPYVFGTTEIEIPLSDVKNLLKINLSKM